MTRCCLISYSHHLWTWFTACFSDEGVQALSSRDCPLITVGGGGVRFSVGLANWVCTQTHRALPHPGVPAEAVALAGRSPDPWQSPFCLAGGFPVSPAAERGGRPLPPPSLCCRRRAAAQPPELRSLRSWAVGRAGLGRQLRLRPGGWRPDVASLLGCCRCVHLQPVLWVREACASCPFSLRTGLCAGLPRATECCWRRGTARRGRVATGVALRLVRPWAKQRRDPRLPVTRSLTWAVLPLHQPCGPCTSCVPCGGAGAGHSCSSERPDLCRLFPNEAYAAFPAVLAEFFRVACPFRHMAPRWGGKGD